MPDFKMNARKKLPNSRDGDRNVTREKIGMFNKAKRSEMIFRDQYQLPSVFNEHGK